MKQFRDSNYYVTRDGRVTATKKVEYLKAQLDRGGYFKVLLYLNKKGFGFFIHRLVAELYVPNPNNYTCVNHIDGNKLNNSIENLEWCTMSQNTRHALNTGLFVAARGENQHTHKLKERQVLRIRKLYETTSITQKELAKKYKVNPSTISDIITRVSWKHI